VAGAADTTVGVVYTTAWKAAEEAAAAGAAAAEAVYAAMGH